jgi:MFS family permease
MTCVETAVSNLSTDTKHHLSPVAVFLYVFLPFALGHYLSLLLRNVNAVLASHLMGSLSLSPGQLGLLTSAFFFAFVVAQLPVGTALDRYGPRRVQLVLMLVAAFGALLFAKGESFGELVLARALMGFGVGGTLMGAVKAIGAWMSPKKLPSLHGYLIAVGGLGAASATTPVRLMLHYTDWRGLFMGLAAVTAAVAVLIWLVTPRVAPQGSATLPSMQSLLEVCRNKTFRNTISLVLLPHNVVLGIQGLWIARWLSDVAHFSDAAVAYLLYLSMAAVIFGAIGVGIVTEWAGKRGVKPIDVAAIGVGVFLLVQVAMLLNYKPSFELLAVLFTLIGTITGIEYSIVAQSMPPELAKRGTPCLNMLIFSGAFLVQAGFGQIIGLWRPDALGHYPAVAYQVGFGVLILIQLPGLVLHCLRRRPVQCELGALIFEDDYEIGTVRPSR